MEDCIDFLKTDKKYSKKNNNKKEELTQISLSEQKLENTAGSNGLHPISKRKLYFLSDSMNILWSAKAEINKRQGDFLGQIKWKINVEQSK